MATTGRLSSGLRTRIQDGMTIQQTWVMYIPTDSNHTTWFRRGIDSGIFSPKHPAANVDEYWDGESVNCVIRAGSRKHQVWNPSPNVEVAPKAAIYSFVVKNDNGAFYEGTSNSIFDLSSSFLASPYECLIVHRLYLMKQTASGGHTWSELEHMAFTGRIKELIHDDIANSDGEPVGVQTTITCEQVGAWDALRRKWTIDDATDVEMAYGSVSYDWTVT